MYSLRIDVYLQSISYGEKLRGWYHRDELKKFDQPMDYLVVEHNYVFRIHLVYVFP